jgi:hypothetical protein
MIIAARPRRSSRATRFQHNKVFIKRDQSGAAQRVLFGSMNFLGPYVQSNNTSWSTIRPWPACSPPRRRVQDRRKAKPFQQDKISQAYMVGSARIPAIAEVPIAAALRLEDLAADVRPHRAARSVLFAVMAPTGQPGGLAARDRRAADRVQLRTVETDTGLAVQSPNGEMGEVELAALTNNVPWPFTGSSAAAGYVHPRQVRRGRLQRRQSDRVHRSSIAAAVRRRTATTWR